MHNYLHMPLFWNINLYFCDWIKRIGEIFMNLKRLWDASDFITNCQGNHQNTDINIKLANVG